MPTLFLFNYTNKIFEKKITKLNSNIISNLIIKRTMFSRLIKITKITGTQNYSIFSVTSPRQNEFDTTKNAPSSHPSLNKFSCDSRDCGKKNCAKDNSSCDKDTFKVEVVAHLTQSSKSVEESKATVELPDHKGPRGGPVIAVIHKKPELIPEQDFYEGNMYKDTVAIQKNENTEVLNKYTNNKHNENNKEQEDKNE